MSRYLYNATAISTVQMFLYLFFLVNNKLITLLWCSKKIYCEWILGNYIIIIVTERYNNMADGVLHTIW